MKQKKKRVSPLHRKRHGLHQKRSTDFLKTYHPFLPLLSVALVVFAIFGFINNRQIKPQIQSSPVQNDQVQTNQSEVLAYSTGVSQNGLLSSTNQRRASGGVANLSINSQLNQAAQAKANDMANRNYWSHNTPEGTPPWIFFTNAGYSYSKAGENLACGFDQSSEVITGWFNSPSHKANLLDPDYKDVGFGIANSDPYNCGSYPAGPQTIIVAMYGTPYSSSPAPNPTPTPAPTPAPTSKPKSPVSAPSDPGSPTFDSHKVILTILNFDGTPAKGTKVTLHSTPKTATTDDNGVVTFTDVEPGDHNVEVDVNGAKSNTSITLEPKEEVFKLNIIKPDLGSNKTSISDKKVESKPKSTSVNRLTLFAEKYTSWVLSGLIILSLLGVGFVLIKHSIAAHKFFVKGEQYVLKHKFVDLAVIFMLIALYFLTRSVGVIL